MTKVLFITANPNSAEGSFGMAVGKLSSKLIKMNIHKTKL